MFLYVSSFEDLEAAPGIEKKIRGQLKFFYKKLGDYIVIYTKNENIYFEKQLKNENSSRKVIIGKIGNEFSKVLYYRKVYHFLINNNFRGENNGDNIAYIRFSTFDVYMLMLINYLKNTNWRVILEIPTYSFINEWKKAGIKGLYKFINFYLFGKDTLKKIDLIVSIGSEPKEPALLKQYSDKIIVINNGIDLESIKVSEKITSSDMTNFNVIGVANVAPWHGYDRVIHGLYNYYNYNLNTLPKIVFHVVGVGPSLSDLQKLVKSTGLENYVKFHGIKTGEELEKLFSQSDVAIGSLGLHRTGGGNPLKNREYCARGIPFVYAGDDPGFPEDFPYAIKVPSDDSPMQIDEVLKFYSDLILRFPNYKTEMRKYAEQNFDWEQIMRRVLNTVVGKEAG